MLLIRNSPLLRCLRRICFDFSCYKVSVCVGCTCSACCSCCFCCCCWRFYVTQIFALLTNTAKAAKNLAWNKFALQIESQLRRLILFWTWFWWRYNKSHGLTPGEGAAAWGGRHAECGLGRQPGSTLNLTLSECSCALNGCAWEPACH